MWWGNQGVQPGDIMETNWVTICKSQTLPLSSSGEFAFLLNGYAINKMSLCHRVTELEDNSMVCAFSIHAV